MDFKSKNTIEIILVLAIIFAAVYAVVFSIKAPTGQSKLFLLNASAISDSTALEKKQSRQVSFLYDADPKIDARLNLLLKNPKKFNLKSFGFASLKEAEKIPVIIVGDSLKQQLETIGISADTFSGNTATARVVLSKVPQILALKAIESVNLARTLEPQIDISAPEVGANLCWNESSPPFAPPYPGLTGRNVVIGVVDTGIDLTHEDFKNSNGETRIKFLWDQTVSGSSPSGFNYGTEWSQAQINAGASTEIDAVGHGTAIAGVAAGNGRATGNNKPNYRYVGIAPEADLIIVKTTNLENNLIDGANYIFQKADELGEDAVVLITVGSRFGGHDGSYYLDTAMSSLTGSGKIIAAAAGNSGEKAWHANASAAKNQITAINFSIPSYEESPSISEYFEFEGWHDSGASFNIKLTSPNGYSTGWITPNNSSGIINSPDGSMLLENAQIANSKGAKKIYGSINDITNAPAVGTWTIEVQRLGRTIDGTIDFWLSDWLLNGFEPGVFPAFISHVEMNKLLLSPSTGNGIISVGAFVSKNSWISCNNQNQSTTSQLGAIASFSNPGPRRDGVQRPDITAPGALIMSALSAQSNLSDSSTTKADDCVHKGLSGTSVATPHVVGAIALLLEEHPNLTVEGARAMIRNNAIKDDFTKNVPNPSWGYGKLSVVCNQQIPLNLSFIKHDDFTYVVFGTKPIDPSTITNDSVYLYNTYTPEQRLDTRISGLTNLYSYLNGQGFMWSHNLVDSGQDYVARISGIKDTENNTFPDLYISIDVKPSH